MRLQDVRIRHIYVLFILPLTFFFSARKLSWLLYKYLSRSEQGLLVPFQGLTHALSDFVCFLCVLCKQFYHVNLHARRRPQPSPIRNPLECEFKLPFPDCTPDLPNLNFWVGFRDSDTYWCSGPMCLSTSLLANSSASLFSVFLSSQEAPFPSMYPALVSSLLS